jgi:uncharacterized protein YigE (DUF2233 family)
LFGIIWAVLTLGIGVADVWSPSLATPWVSAFLKNKIHSIELPNKRIQGLHLDVLEEKNPQSPKYGLSLVWLVMPAAEVQWRISEPRTLANANATFAQAADTEDIIIESGGYFGNKEDGTNIPIGLVIAAGKQTSAKAHWKSGGVLIKRSGETGIVPIAAFTPDGITEALQSKPLLVKSGAMDILSNQPDLYNRTAIGLDATGNYICVGAFIDSGRALSLFEFAELLCRLREAGGPIIRDALALDGGPSSHLYIPCIHKHFGYAADRYVPNILRFSSTEQEDAKKK